MNDYGIKGGQGHDEFGVVASAKWMLAMILVAALLAFACVMMSGCIRPPAKSIPILR